MKALALAFALAATTTAFGGTLTCNGEGDGKQVQVVIERDDATKVVTSLSATVDGVAVGNYSGEGNLASEQQEVTGDDGTVMPVTVIIGANETTGVLSVLIEEVPSEIGPLKIAVTAIVSETVTIEEAVLVCQ